jgi:hypothetical protein
MPRRRWLIAQIALVGVLVALALPASSSALSAVFIALTSTGPSPATLTIPAGLHPVWMNQDTVSHTVTFGSGCSIEVGPGGIGQCTDGLGTVVGDYAYTVDGTTQASVTVTPEWRGVTLHGKRHGFRRGSKVLLHGTLAIATSSPPVLSGPRMPVTVFARPDRSHAWHRVAVVMAKPLQSSHLPAHSVWELWVRPHGSTTYMAVADSQPKAGQYWTHARSCHFGVYLRH